MAGPVKPDWQIHICNPRKWGASAASAALPTPRALWQRESFDWCRAMNVFPAAISTALAMAFIAAGCSSARAFTGWKSRLLFADRYHRYVMQAEREMYEDSHLRGVICNAEMIKREIIEDFGLPAEDPRYLQRH